MTSDSFKRQAKINQGLYTASEKGDEARARAVIEQGADVNFRHPLTGLTPLHVAAHELHHALVDLLVSSGADVDATGVKAKLDQLPQTWTPMLCCYFDNDMVARLLKHGATADFQDAKEGTTVLHMAARNNYSDVVLTLLKHGARRDLRNHDGMTAFQEAQANEATDVIQMWTGYELAEKAQSAIDDGDAAHPKPL